ncbi:MAG: type-F conjugative transfer system secretin TraK [Candidatus Micrarchaeaceae archaeon]
MKAKTLIISSAVLAVFALNAYAKTPQQNNIEVQKALQSLKQGLEMQDNTNAHIQIVVAPKQTAAPVPAAVHQTAEVYKSGIIKPAMPQAFINGISVSPNTVVINHDGKIFYKIVKENTKTVVLDIINPVYDIGTQNYKPDQTGNILNVIAAYYTDRALYGYPYLRIVIYLKKDVSYSVGSVNSAFALSFGSSLPTNETVGQSAPTAPVATVQTTTPQTTTPLQLELMQKINQLEQQVSQLKNQNIAVPKKNPNLEQEFKQQSSPIKQAQTVEISLENISCIKSPYPVSQVIYSKEDNLQIQVSGNNVFVKILPLKILEPDGTYKYKYSSKPRDIYIVTPEHVYSINLVPKPTPAITYYLSQPEQNPQLDKLQSLQKNLEQKQINFAQTSQNTFSSDTSSNYTSRLLKWIREAYIGKTPDGFVLMPFDFAKKYEQFSLTGEYKFVGANSIIYAYKLTANYDLNLDPSQFVWLVPKAMAATIVNPQPKKDESTQIFIVGGK